MRIWVVLLAACGGSDAFEAGAAVTVDGAAIELTSVTAAKVDTIFDLTAVAADGSTLAIAFPTDAPTGARTCLDGRVVGEVTVDFTDAGGTKFASYFPLTDAANDCAFDLVSTGTQIELAGLQASLTTDDGLATRTLTDGEFRARVTP